MDLSMDFAAAQKSISQALIETTRSAAQVSAQDVAFYRSSDPELGASLERQNARLLSLTQRLLRRASASTNSQPVSLGDAESIDTKWRTLVDVADGLLERADACLDEYSGLIKRSSPQQQPSSPAPMQRSGTKRNTFRSQNIAKPQLKFDIKPANHETEPFTPILTSKPHPLVPLEQSRAILPNEFGKLQYQHPYAAEIEDYNYPSFVYRQADPQPYTSFDATSADFVDDLEGVRRMLEELKKASVIAVDLEHHDTHSYIGIVSLMQISTRDHDWIIDTLKPWRRRLEILNDVFADPNILKVFHGAHMDIMWLQRDLGLYVVGLFDTHHASRVLGYAGGSLAFLLKKFIDFDAQKQYQTADWRIRPLPSELFDYARSDTHFLLYICDMMRNELIEKSDFAKPEQNKILDVLEKSKETSLQRYEHSIYDEDRGLGRGGWFSLLSKTAFTLSKEQFAVFRKVHYWRDLVARQEDESAFYIMPNHAVFNVARTVPQDLPALLSLLHPISQPVRSRTTELLAIVLEAAAGAADGPEVNDVLNRIAKETGKIPSSFQGKEEIQDTSRGIDSKITGDLRSNSSQFWGLTLPNTADLSGRLQRKLATFEATPQIPYRNGDNFSPAALSNTENGPSLDLPSPSNATAPAPPVHVALGKRKADNMASEDPSTIDNLPQRHQSEHHASEKDETAEIMRKMQSRAERKAAKQSLSSTEHTQSTGNGSTDGSAEANQFFDYGTAPSVLNADEKKLAKQPHKSKQQTPYNLYAKAANVPSAAGQTQNPKTGRSRTFKR